ncbi:hypothetical protein [Nocardioides zhouii]|uniref:Uncharacterized protein n=1 Tax=Nocardioides zhouii TaxID=1168729 RepID=A0A4Q2T1X3_9ACTN|nr:hypothetical protein [Nocardioides zhouii]RYC12645.1 hypothetical protein EUA94_08250 [Nocardioides zhouii]
MTDTDLRDLFRAAAPDQDLQDPAAIDRAWRDGTRRRVGSRVGVVAATAAAAAIVTGVAVLASPGGRVAPAPAPSTSPTPSATASATGQAPVARPAGEYAGAPIWWAPSAVEEADLPVLPVAGLPAVINLEGAEVVGSVGEPVVALFAGRGERVLALTESQRAVEIDISRLEPVTDEEGNGRTPLSHASLSGDRLRAFFVQDSSIEVLDLMTGAWTTVDTPDWLAEGARWLMTNQIWVPDALGDDSSGVVHSLDGETSVADVDWVQGWTGADEPWGPVAVGRAGTAQAAFLAGGVSGGSVSNPQALMVDRHGDRTALALDYGFGGDGTRSKGCCLPLGWIGGDTVLFSSSSTEGQRILAWDVGTEDVHLVSEIVGRVSIAQLADLS